MNKPKIPALLENLKTLEKLTEVLGLKKRS